MLHGQDKARRQQAVRGRLTSGPGNGLPTACHIHTQGRGGDKPHGGRLEVTLRDTRRLLELSESAEG